MTSKLKGLEKIWREIKRPFRRLYRHAPEEQVAMPIELVEHTKEYADARHKPFLAEVYLRDDGRVNLPRIELYPVLGCNLRCQHCAILSPYRKGVIRIEEIVRWCETWNKKIRPVKLLFVGGEPFLHPDLASIIIESHRIWDDSELEIVSNGLLIPQTSQSVLDALKQTKTRAVISDHSGTDLSSEKIVAACTILREKGIPYELRQSNTHWRVQHQFKENGTPVAFQSSPRDAWSVCLTRHCHTLHNNRLYKCSILASVIEGVNEGALSSELWKGALSYSPLSSDADTNSILEHFRSGFVEACSVCPEKCENVESRQLSAVELRQLKQRTRRTA